MTRSPPTPPTPTPSPRESVQGALSVPSVKVLASGQSHHERSRVSISRLRSDRSHLFRPLQILQPRTLLAERDYSQQRNGPCGENKSTLCDPGVHGLSSSENDSFRSFTQWSKKKWRFWPRLVNNHILEVTETTPMQAQVKLTYYTGDQPYRSTSFERNLPFKTLFAQHDPLGQ